MYKVITLLKRELVCFLFITKRKNETYNYQEMSLRPVDIRTETDEGEKRLEPFGWQKYARLQNLNIFESMNNEGFGEVCGKGGGGGK